MRRVRLGLERGDLLVERRRFQADKKLALFDLLTFDDMDLFNNAAAGMSNRLDLGFNDDRTRQADALIDRSKCGSAETKTEKHENHSQPEPDGSSDIKTGICPSDG